MQFLKICFLMVVAKIGSIDTMFAQLVVAPSWATMLAGFVVVLAIVFLGVVAFGKSKVQVGTFGIMVLAFIGVVISTAIGLFPSYILILFLVLSLVMIIIKSLFFRGGV